MKLATCCLLAILTSTTALAQTHPKKKLVRKQVVVRRQFAPRMPMTEFEPCLGFPEDFEHCGLKTAVAESFDPEKVYTYVEQMPTLNGQEAFRASIAAISQCLVVPPTAPAGRVFVKFEVSRDGRVSHPQIVKSLRVDLDSAVLVATRQIPQFTPGKQGGKVVTVSFTLPITIAVKKQP